MIFKRIFLLPFFLLVISASALAQKTPFSVSLLTPSIVIQPGEVKTLRLQIEIPNNFFVYQGKTKLEFLDLKELKIQSIGYPPSKKRQDPFFKKILDVYEGEAALDVILEAPQDISPGRRTLEAILTLQGCSDILCYPLENHLVTFDVAVGLAQGAVSKGSEPSPSLWELVKTQNFSEVVAKGWWIVLCVVFLGGLLTSLTPCVLPVIPVTLLIIGVRAESPMRRNFLLSLVLVLGLSLTYAFLGVLAVGLGKSLGFVFQQKGFVIFLSLAFFVLSLSLFGFFEIHLPQKLASRLNQIKGHGLWGAFVSGMAAGLLAAPCAGPVIGALLLFVAATQNYLEGFGLLFVYAIGMGVLFLILGTGYGTLQARFKSSRLTVWVKRFLGLLLLLASLFYLNTVFPLQKSLDGFLKRPTPAGWLSSEEEGLKMARLENKVMLIDFYADWCAPCKELEIGFFRRKEVVSLLKEMVPVRIDATFGDKPDIEKVLDKYHVVGWPTIVFVSPKGQVLKDLTVVSYNPSLLLQNMKKAIDTHPFLK